MKEIVHHEDSMAVLSTNPPTSTLSEEQLDSASPFFGFSPAEPNARFQPLPEAGAKRRLLAVGCKPSL